MKSAPGILSDGDLAALFDDGRLTSACPLDADQIQPASLDLRLGEVAYRVRASFLPGAGRTVAERLADPRLSMHAVDLRGGAVLETGCVYIAPLRETLFLPADVAGSANPKSSTGRIDVFVRVIVDGADAFDAAPAGYRGPLYAEISPRTFSVLVRPGERLCQLRLRRGGPAKAPRSLTVSVDLSGELADGIAGFRARRHAGLIDLAKIGGHEAADFWEPIRAPERAMVLDPGEFYILASKERIEIPALEAAEMAPIATEIGEFRAHYAGFFDPGFGLNAQEGPGRAVLEVRGRDVPFILEHGQAAAKLVYEPMAAAPRRLYGQTGSHYQAQGLKLSKHFRPWGR